MSSQPSAATEFQHEPLVDPQTHIRLLKIVKGSLERRVSCTLTTWLLDSAPSYYAISYTWGNPSDTATILIDGKPKVVRRNCEYVLQQASASSVDTYFWVDDICIDQSLNEEKNHQVSMMGDLYKRATRVFACVGEHADDSDFLMGVLESRQSFFTQLCKAITTYETESSLEWTGSRPQLSMPPRFQDGHFRTSLFRIRGRVSQAFVRFLKRPYFSRVWVLQELYSGNGRITLCCGMDHQPLQSFLALGLLVQHWIVYRGIIGSVVDHVLGLLRFSTSISIHVPIGFHVKSLFWNMKAQRGCLSAGAAPNMRPSNLPRLLQVMSDFQCENPRDKIYGIRSLVDWHGHAVPFPDYSKDLFDLAAEILGIVHTQLRWETVFEWCEHPMILQAGNLRKLLALSMEQPLLREAVRLRQGPPPDQDHPSRLPGQETKPRQGEILWWGSQLGDYYKSKQCDMYTEIRGRHGKVVAYAPKDTRPGDWFLTCRKEFAYMRHDSWYWTNRWFAKQSLDSSGLIIRPLAEKQCSIIGPTFPARAYSKEVTLQTPKCFVIWWDSEDLLVLEWRNSQYSVHKKPTEQADVCFGFGFGLRVSIAPGSSLVRGPFDSEFIQEELKKNPAMVFLEPDFKGEGVNEA